MPHPCGQFGIDLYWIPLGAGGNFVRLNGRIYEAIEAAIQRRPRYSLYHSALMIDLPEGRYTIEQTPAGPHPYQRGVVGIGPIGARWAARFHVFRYELRRWRDGVIPDLNEAVDSPQRLSSDLADARRLLELVPEVPFLVWGRDELGVGDMWNSNSQVSWLIARTGLDFRSVKPPKGGRAPGWDAGVVAAALEERGARKVLGQQLLSVHRTAAATRVATSNSCRGSGCARSPGRPPPVSNETRSNFVGS